MSLEKGAVWRFCCVFFSFLLVGFSVVWADTVQESREGGSSEKRFKRSLDMGLEFGLFLTKLDTEGSFRKGEQKFDFQQDVGLVSYAMFPWVQFEFRYNDDALKLEWMKINVVGRSDGRSRNLSLGGEYLDRTQGVRSTQSIERWGVIFYHSLLGRAIQSYVQGAMLEVFGGIFYVGTSQKISALDGSLVRFYNLSFAYPRFGFMSELTIFYSTPRNRYEILHPPSFMTFVLQFQGIAFLEYGGRRLPYDYELVVGFRLKPAEFFHLTVSYRTWEVVIKGTERGKKIQLYTSGLDVSGAIYF